MVFRSNAISKSFFKVIPQEIDLSSSNASLISLINLIASALFLVFLCSGLSINLLTVSLERKNRILSQSNSSIFFFKKPFCFNFWKRFKFHFFSFMDGLVTLYFFQLNFNYILNVIFKPYC